MVKGWDRRSIERKGQGSEGMENGEEKGRGWEVWKWPEGNGSVVISSSCVTSFPP